MSTKAELQAALKAQEHALKEARLRETFLLEQLRAAQIATKVILDDLRRKRELPTHYDETGQELAERYETGIQLASTRAETICQALDRQSSVDLTDSLWRPTLTEDEAYIEYQRMLQEIPTHDTNPTTNENN